MIIFAALFSSCVAASPVDDFFPLVSGTKWTYEDGSGVQLEDEIGDAIDIGKSRMVTPKTTRVSGRVISCSLFHAEGDTVYLVGSLDPRAKKPEPNLFDESQPILKVGPGRSNWKYLGSLAMSNGPVSVHVEGESNRGPKRKILEREVETLTVHVVMKFGTVGQATETQDAVYAKGIGLVEMTDVTKAQGETVKKVLKLVKFEPPQG